jgi:Zn-dependent protease
MVNKMIEWINKLIFSGNPLEWAIRVLVLLFAITIHEYSHGKAALSLGDPTAKNAGRLTLNPLSHLDPLGTACMFIFRFGWAKPVPVNTSYFSNRRNDTIIMALSGPLSNLAAAFVAGICIRYFMLRSEIYLAILYNLICMNIGLGLFNLLPIPPLDGSYVLENLLPPSAAKIFHQTRRHLLMIFIGILLIAYYMKFNLLGILLSKPFFWLAELFGGKNFIYLDNIYKYLLH